LTKKIKNIQEIWKTEGEKSKTIVVPRSKETDEIFDLAWDFNVKNPSFDPSVKIDARYEVGGINLIQGYCQLVDIVIKERTDFDYKVVVYGTTSDFFNSLKDIYMDALDLSLWDHPFTAEIQQFSWEDQVYFDGGLIPFEFGNGYVYPLVDYGMTSDLQNWYYKDMPCCFYLKTIVDQMFLDQGFQYDSEFFDSDFFKRLIIPFSPEQFALTTDEIADRTFVANVPEFVSTGTDTSPNQSTSGFGPLETIRFTNEVSDDGLNYDPTTGVFTATNAGAMKFTAVIDMEATFTPSTGASVTQTSELHGYFKIVFNDGGGDVVVDSVLVICQVDQESKTIFTVGPRTSDGSPSYPSGDYRSFNTWSLFGDNSAPNEREVNPPNRFKLTWSDGNIQFGDTVRVVWQGWYRESADSSETFFQTAGGSNSVGTCNLTLLTGAFYNSMVNNEMAEGNTLLISKLLPSNIKQLDFFSGIVKMFNLFVIPDPNNKKKLRIEPRDDFLGTTDSFKKNIHTKVDRKSITVKPIALQNFKEMVYTYKPDKDYLNEKYSARYEGHVYGERRIESTNEFNQNTAKTEVIFSATPSAAPPDSDLVIPTILDINEDGTAKSLKHNIRILYYGGMRDTENVWSLQGDFVFDPAEEFVEYPYAGMWDDPYTPTLSLCFGNEEEVFYDPTVTPIEQTSNNLGNAYHVKQLLQITDKQSQLVECDVDMDFGDYDEFTFDLLYFFDEAYWRLQEIKNFNPSVVKNTRCVFLKFIDVGDFQAGTIGLDDADDGVDPLFPGGDGSDPSIDPGEKKAVLGGKAPMQSDGNSYYSKTTNVKGKDNYVNTTAKWVEIEGDGNRVYAGAMNISLKNSNNNTIESGVFNVTLIGTDGLYIDEPNVTYINGVKATDHHSGQTVIEALETLEVVEDKQMTIWGTLENDGIIEAEGELIIEE
jgi:hypothetical protein